MTSFLGLWAKNTNSATKFAFVLSHLFHVLHSTSCKVGVNFILFDHIRGWFHHTFSPSQIFLHMAFGKEITVQVHQQSSKAKIRFKFAKICTPLAKCCYPKRRHILWAKSLHVNVDKIKVYRNIILGTLDEINFRRERKQSGEFKFHICLRNA